MTLAERLDSLFRELDPYGYVDAEGSVEQCEWNIKNKPEDVIEWLILELEKEE